MRCSVGHKVKVQGVAYGNVWVSSVRDVLFGCKGNGLGIYLRMSGVVALGSLLVQVTHTESGPASFLVGGQGHWTLGRTGGISLRNGQGIDEPGVFTCGSLQHV